LKRHPSAIYIPLLAIDECSPMTFVGLSEHISENSELGDVDDWNPKRKPGATRKLPSGKERRRQLQRTRTIVTLVPFGGRRGPTEVNVTLTNKNNKVLSAWHSVLPIDIRAPMGKLSKGESE
jgi:hypothetical protein